MCVPASAASASVGGAVVDFGLWAAQSVIGVLIEQGVEAASETWWGTVLGEDFNAADFEEGGKYHPGGTFDEGTGAGRAELAERYNQYVTDLQTDLGTSTINADGGFYLYAIPTEFSKSAAPATLGAVSTFGPYSFTKGNVWFVYPAMTAPVSGYYTYFRNLSMSDGSKDAYANKMESGGAAGATTVNYTTRTAVNAGAELIREKFNKVYIKLAADDFYSGSLSHGWFVEPLSGDMLDFTSLDVSINSRPSSIVGDYGIMGDDGSIVKVEGGSLVNESEKLVYSPTTAGEITYTDCVFDYADRSYTLTLEDGSTMKVVYGDENVTIHEGDTVYNVYYLSSDSGSGGSGGSGDTGDDGSGGIGGAIGGLFDVLGEIIYSLIEGLINLATKALSALTGLLDLLKQFAESIIGFFGGYTDFLAAAFPFLPEETFTILNLGLILLIAAAVFKKFL